MSEAGVIENVEYQTSHDVILTRTLKNDLGIMDRCEDLEMLLKMRENRLRISKLRQSFFDEEFNISGDESEFAQFTTNLEAVQELLRGVRENLRGPPFDC